MHSKAMNLLSLVLLAFLTSSFLGWILGHAWEIDAESQTNDGIRDTFERSAFKPRARKYGQFEDYIRVQKNNDLTKSHMDRIIGGTLASPGEIPWQASMSYVTARGTLQHSCGAAILSPLWLLSAAHCYYGYKNLEWRGAVGEQHLDREDEGEQSFDVDRIFVHENFSDANSENDIALIRVRPSSNGRGIVFNKFVQPIDLPKDNTSLETGTMLIISGWGGTIPCKDCQNEPQVYSKILLKAEVPIIDQKECQKQYILHDITKRMVCAGYKNGKIDGCLGDSGGPAAYEYAGHCVLYGIVSWGDGCGQPVRPGVYTRVTEFLPWIEDTMKANS